MLEISDFLHFGYEIYLLQLLSTHPLQLRHHHGILGVRLLELGLLRIVLRVNLGLIGIILLRIVLLRVVLLGVGIVLVWHSWHDIGVLLRVNLSWVVLLVLRLLHNRFGIFNWLKGKRTHFSLKLS